MFYDILLNGIRVAQTEDTTGYRHWVYGLANDTTFVLSVKATGSIFTGQESRPYLTATLSPTPPGRITNGRVVQESGGHLAIRIDPPSDTGGVAIKAIHLYMSHMGSAAIQVASGSPNETIHVFGLNHSTAYDFYAIAENELSLEGPKSRIYRFTTGPMSLPDVTPAPTAVDVSGRVPYFVSENRWLNLPQASSSSGYRWFTNIILPSVCIREPRFTIH